jgi:glutamate-5-semialdehyde dehydrogenase
VVAGTENKSDLDTVREVAARAAAAAPGLRRVGAQTIDAALRRAAELIRERGDAVLAANAMDVEAGTAAGMTQGLLDRLRLDPDRLAAIAGQLEAIAATPEPPAERLVRTLPTGERVLVRQVPVGVIGAIFEARPNVTVDVASQVLKARSAAVLRTGSAALASATALLADVLSPALADAGIPPDAVALISSQGHGTADALVGMPELVPLVVVRGSGAVTRRLAGLGAAAGTRVLAHADGGGVLYLDGSADVDLARRLITDGLDRLGVCNRLNLLLIDKAKWDVLLPAALDALEERRVAASMPPHPHPLGHEWALDSGAESHVTVGEADGPEDAAVIANTATSGIAATICATDRAAAERFLDAYQGTGAFWNISTRMLDGYKLLGLPETGINVDRTPGPRGPVTYPDLTLRQFVVLPPE